jgi:hypothetical protein
MAECNAFCSVEQSNSLQKIKLKEVVFFSSAKNSKK